MGSRAPDLPRSGWYIATAAANSYYPGLRKLRSRIPGKLESPAIFTIADERRSGQTLVRSRQICTLLLALGGNTPGRWGAPHETFARAVKELEAAGIAIVGSSYLYETAAVGAGRQQEYLNAVLVAHAGLAPGSLLRLAKQLERRAGRKATPPMRSRPLDIDILDYGGRRLNTPCAQRERGRLVLPHPLLAGRAFVLVPLMEIAPHWRHPTLGCRPGALLARLGPRGARGVRRVLDFRLRACEKAPR
jgi:2-amino-4-hydroxy-6-hydroxymethyldihydropteridine diphosphokinase